METQKSPLSVSFSDWGNIGREVGQEKVECAEEVSASLLPFPPQPIQLNFCCHLFFEKCSYQLLKGCFEVEENRRTQGLGCGSRSEVKVEQRGRSF